MKGVHVLALVAVAGAFLAVPLAAAHADLQSADPAPNGHAPAGITMVTLTFTEDVVRDQYTAADCKDLSGKSVASGPILFDDARHNVVRVPVKPLTDGVYTVEWKTLSTDTHTLHGGFVFSVGTAALKFATPPSTVSISGASTFQEGVARFVYYAGLFLALGVPVFLLAIDRAAARPRHALVVAGVASIVGGLAATVSLYFLALRTDAWIVDTALSATGLYVAARAGLVALAGVALLAASGSARLRRPALALAIVFATLGILATSLASHAAADRTYHDVSVALDAVHLAMAGLWIGGVVAFALTLAGKTSQDVGVVVTRFTPLALASVGLVLATGTWASLRHIPTLDDLWMTSYGLLVVAKLALLGVLVVIGFLNKQIMGPRLRSGATSPRAFRRILQVEAGTMALVLLAAGVLASTSPPTVAVQTGSQETPLYFEYTNYTAEYHLVVDLAPNPPTVGSPARIIVALHPFHPPLPSGTDVQLDFQDPGTTQPRGQTQAPISSGPNEWTLNGFAFTSAGTWKVFIYVQTGTFQKFSFDVPVRSPTGT